jgi:hypothetical protein
MMLPPKWVSQRIALRLPFGEIAKAQRADKRILLTLSEINSPVDETVRSVQIDCGA